MTRRRAIENARAKESVPHVECGCKRGVCPACGGQVGRIERPQLEGSNVNIGSDGRRRPGRPKSRN